MLPAFQPKWDARRGARELYDAYKKVDLRVEDFEGARYKRIEHPGIAGIGPLEFGLTLAGRGSRTRAASEEFVKSSRRAAGET